MKKVLFACLLLLSAFFVSSCTNPSGTAGRKELLEVKDGLTFSTFEVEEDFELPLISHYGVRITWTSDNSAIVISGDTAVVTRGTTDITVILTATLTLNKLTETKEFTFTVKLYRQVPRLRLNSLSLFRKTRRWKIKS